MQTFGRVSRQNRHLPLSDDLTVIDFLIHVMHRATSYLVAGRERLFPRFEPGKFWEKRWMDIDDAPGERFEYRCMEHAHEASEHHELGTGLSSHINELAFHFRL